MKKHKDSMHGNYIYTSIFQKGCCLNPKGWWIGDPKHHPFNTPKGRSRYGPCVFFLLFAESYEFWGELVMFSLVTLEAEDFFVSVLRGSIAPTRFNTSYD